jgi:hypothetical protein
MGSRKIIIVIFNNMLYILLYCEFNLSIIEYHVINEKMHFLYKS